MVFDTPVQQLADQIQGLQASLDTLEHQRQEAQILADSNRVRVQTGTITESQPVYAREYFTRSTTLSSRYPDPLKVVATRQVQIPVYSLQPQPEDIERLQTIQGQIAEFSEQLRIKTNEFNTATLNSVSGLASMLENAVAPDKPYQPSVVSLGIPAIVIVGGIGALYFLSKK